MECCQRISSTKKIKNNPVEEKKRGNKGLGVWRKVKGEGEGEGGPEVKMHESIGIFEERVCFFVSILRTVVSCCTDDLWQFHDSFAQRK